MWIEGEPTNPKFGERYLLKFDEPKAVIVAEVDEDGQYWETLNGASYWVINETKIIAHLRVPA